MTAYLQSVEQQQEFSEFCEQLLLRKFMHLHLFTGSFYELPLIYFIENITDIDNIYYRRNICAISNDAKPPKDFKGTVLIIQSERSHPGYARLYFKNNHLPYTYAMLPEERPAISQVVLEKSDIAAGISSNFSDEWLATFHGLSHDMVDAIWCPNWPKEAHEWITRERRNEWPLPSTVVKIVNNGCLLVAKPHQVCHFIANELRFSFSEAELILIHTWTDVQMYIYHILRLIKSDVVRKCGGKKTTFITTYHFKTLMFWACEEKSKDFWLLANIEKSVKELILVMIEWLIKKQCRNYFIPGNNMLDNLPDGHNFEKEVRFLIDFANLVYEYISNTVPFASDRRNSRLKEFPVRISTNLLFAMHWRVSHWYVVNPYRPRRQMYKPNTEIMKSHLFLSDSFNLLQCLTLHRQLALSKDLKRKIDRFHDVDQCFKRANETQVSGYMNIYISPMDNLHTMILKLLNTTIDGSDIIDSSKATDQNAKSIPLLRNSRRWELCYSRTDNYVACILETFFNIINEQIPKPSCFHTAAYEANFYWTIFGKEGSAMALESYRRALDICNKWLSYASTIRNGISFRLCYTVQELPIIISNRWSIIFDKYIQVVLGFLSLVKFIANSGFQSRYKILNAGNDFEVIVQVFPLDLLGYIKYQCDFQLKTCFLMDDTFTHNMQNDISRMFLYTAARISTETS